MIEDLAGTEKELMFMLAQGQNYAGISLWLNIDYSLYVKLKKSIFKKMRVKRTTQLFSVLIKNGLECEDL